MEVLINFLTKKVFGNHVYLYIISILILLSFFIFKKIVKYIISNILFKIGEKTEFKFDDILFRSLSPSASMFLFAGLFYFSYNILNLEPKFLVVFDKMFILLIIIPLVYFLIKFSTELMNYYFKEKRKFNEVAVDLMTQIIRIALFVVGILVILDNLGYEVSTLIAGLGVGGLAFALAAQDLLKNLFAGFAIIFDNTFKKGDRIIFEDKIYFVKKIKLRTTELTTLDNTVVTIPNSKLADGITENVQKAPKYKVSMVIGLTYDTSTKKLKRAKEIIEMILRDDEDVDTFWVWFDEFASYSLNIQVIYYQKYNYSNWPERAYVKERINFEIKERLEKEGLEFAFPTQTIELKK